MIIEKTSDIYTGAIRAFLAANFFLDDADDLEAGASLLEHGIMDSTGVLEVVGFIEHTFGVTVEDSELLPENRALCHPEEERAVDVRVLSRISGGRRRAAAPRVQKALELAPLCAFVRLMARRSVPYPAYAGAFACPRTTRPSPASLQTVRMSS